MNKRDKFALAIAVAVIPKVKLQGLFRPENYKVLVNGAYEVADYMLKKSDEHGKVKVALRGSKREIKDKMDGLFASTDTTQLPMLDFNDTPITGKRKRRMWKADEVGNFIKHWNAKPDLNFQAQRTDRPKSSIKTMLMDVHSGRRQLPARFRRDVTALRKNPLPFGPAQKPAAVRPCAVPGLRS